MDSFAINLKGMKESYVKLTAAKEKEKLLQNILESKIQPTLDGKSIFFIESHKVDNKTLSLTPRQACSIEAAGKVFLKIAFQSFMTFQTF